MDKNVEIPFGKPVRVGNFKVWRSMYRSAIMPTDEERKKVREESNGRMKAVGQKIEIEQINVSDMTGAWSVKIPQTSMMYLTITDAFRTTDEDIRNQFLGMVFTNMHNICLINSEALHDALFFLTEMMTFPYLLLSEDEMKERMRKGFEKVGGDAEKFEEHVGKMCEYRAKLYELIEQKKARLIEEYERQQKEKWKKEEEAMTALEQEERAGEALNVLTEGKEENDE